MATSELSESLENLINRSVHPCSGSFLDAETILREFLPDLARMGLTNQISWANLNKVHGFIDRIMEKSYSKQSGWTSEDDGRCMCGNIIYTKYKDCFENCGIQSSNGTIISYTGETSCPDHF